MCIVGEPTELVVATGHKGKTAIRVTCTGVEGHSALAPNALNAIYLATDLITEIRSIQADVVNNNDKDDDYDVPYSTIHVGKIHGGVALNIVPNICHFDFEIRNIASDDPIAILDKIKQSAHAIVATHKERFPQADITFDIFNTYPPLDTNADSNIVSFVKSLTGINHHIKVAFGTEGGIFDKKLGVPTVVCGPGSMEQGHKPDEYLSIDQFEKCADMLKALVKCLEQGI